VGHRAIGVSALSMKTSASTRVGLGPRARRATGALEHLVMRCTSRLDARARTGDARRPRASPSDSAALFVAVAGLGPARARLASRPRRAVIVTHGVNQLRQ
jgi:hypothetical protein